LAKNERGLWEFPGGSVEFGETMADALRREMEEEFDIQIAVGALLDVVDHILPDEEQHWVSPTYLCTITAGTPTIREPGKCTEIGWFALDEMLSELTLITQENLTHYRQMLGHNARPDSRDSKTEVPPSLVKTRVHEYYWTHDWNCASTTLRILAERFGVDIHEQVLDAALGMHGAGGLGAQCGLVEGALMSIGILGKANGLSDDAVVQACHDYATEFESRFGSLLCRELRPQGFHPDNPPHLCEGLSCDAVLFDIAFVEDWLEGGSS